ncbi:MAG: rRNA ((966)-N(2))-methyltransferase RsmD [Bacillota bacterium]
MRIISGKAKGTKLLLPRSTTVRPTQDRIKETLFQILTPYLLDSIVLDLFAGTGSLGLEALSRGASSAVFVDKDPHSTALIFKNAEKTRLAPHIKVYKKSVRAFLKQYDATTSGLFSLVFLDPPYQARLLLPALKILPPLLREQAIVVTEAQSVLPEQISELKLWRTLSFKNTIISLFKY